MCRKEWRRLSTAVAEALRQPKAQPQAKTKTEFVGIKTKFTCRMAKNRN